MDAERDVLYSYDEATHKDLCIRKPWKSDPKYFTHVRISAVALIKMVMHARSGGSIEIMGLMQGYVTGTSLIITDAFRLPVEGTETRVNAQEDANEYMVEYLKCSREQGRQENAVGWYHSHPGYGCWLSGIDVNTQSMQQSYNDPFVAIVIDPERTISVGKVEIGAFRTYPEGHKSSVKASTEDTSNEFKTVPLNKIEDFGAHSDRYYSLDVLIYRSTLDNEILEQLWQKYWVQTLSQNLLLMNRDFSNKQMTDLAAQTLAASKNIEENCLVRSQITGPGGIHKHLHNIAKSSSEIEGKEWSGLAAIEVRETLFNRL